MRKPPEQPAPAPTASMARQLQYALRQVRQLQEHLSQRRQQRLLVIGAMLSLTAHVVLLIVLAFIYRQGPGGPGVQPVSYEFAIIPDEQLSDFEEIDVDDLLSETPEPETAMTATPEVALEASPPAVELDAADAGSISLGATGASDGEPVLSGGAAGTSFFGVSSKGTRFAYIVDRSGSMQGHKMQVALQELVRSIDALPDYAYFYILLFSSDVIAPSMQRGWMSARRSNIQRVVRWLNEWAEATGGTEPRPAFLQVFSLDVRPDVVFFLTDGEIPDFTAAEVAALNGRGKRVVINTIAFGNAGAQELLRQIAADSGGSYRFVPIPE